MISAWLAAFAFWLSITAPGPHDVTIYATDGELRPVPVVAAFDCDLAGASLQASRTGVVKVVTVGADRCRVLAVTRGKVYRRQFAPVGNEGWGWAIAGGSE